MKGKTKSDVFQKIVLHNMQPGAWRASRARCKCLSASNHNELLAMSYCMRFGKNNYSVINYPVYKIEITGLWGPVAR